MCVVRHLVIGVNSTWISAHWQATACWKLGVLYVEQWSANAVPRRDEIVVARACAAGIARLPFHRSGHVPQATTRTARLSPRHFGGVRKTRLLLPPSLCSPSPPPTPRSPRQPLTANRQRPRTPRSEICALRRFSARRRVPRHTTTDAGRTCSVGCWRRVGRGAFHRRRVCT